MLRSDCILWELVEHRAELKEQHCPGFAKLLQMSMNEYRPSQFRQEDLRSAMHLLTNTSKTRLELNYSYDFLYKWYDELFQINGSEIHLRPGQEEIASVIFSKIHPYTIIAFYLAEKYNKNFYNICDLLQFAKTTTPLASIKPTPGTDFARSRQLSGNKEAGGASASRVGDPTTG